MSNRQPKTFCRIIDYVDSVDPELAKSIRAVCADSSLGIAKGKSGITFLMPQSKEWIKLFADLAFSEKTEDADRANDMINALIIRDSLKTPADWMKHRDDIPNSLYPSQHVEIEGVTATEVKFKSGAVASVDTKFQDSSRRKNLSVWKLKGEIPVTKDKPAKQKYAKGGKNSKSGGYEVSSLDRQKERFKIALAVENDYVIACSRGENPRDVYTRTSLSIVNYLLNVRHDENTVIEKVLPLISLDALDFYLLVEPHRSMGEPLLDDNLIADWWKWKSSTPPCDCQAAVAKIQELLNSQKSSALIYSADGRKKIESAKLDLINDLCRAIQSNVRKSPSMIQKAYAALEANNAIGGVGPVLPEQLVAFYRSEPGLKEVQDELRYLTFGWFKEIESTKPFDLGRFHEITNFIGEYLHAGTGEDRAKVLKLLNEKTIQFQIAPEMKAKEINHFVCSTMFLYTPLLKSEVENGKLKRPTTENFPKMNFQDWLYTRHARVLGHKPNDNTNIILALRSLDPATLSDDMKKELREKFGVM